MPGFSVLLTILFEEVYLNQICFELNLLFVFEVQNPCVRPAEFSFEGRRMLNPNLNFPKHCPNPDEPVGAKRKSRFVGEPKMINHESTKFGKHKIFLFFRVFFLSCFRDKKVFS